jgi:predicted nucleotidyltransferase
MLTKTEIEKIKAVVSSRSAVDYAILFGSALKHPRAHSDIDLLIGGDLDPRQKTDLSMALTLELHRTIDIVLTKEARCDVVLRAFSSGIALVARDKGKMKEDYFNHYRLCDQGHLLKRVRLERLKRVYGNG